MDKGFPCGLNENMPRILSVQKGNMQSYLSKCVMLETVRLIVAINWKRPQTGVVVSINKSRPTTKPFPQLDLAPFESLQFAPQNWKYPIFCTVIHGQLFGVPLIISRQARGQLWRHHSPGLGHKATGRPILRSTILIKPPYVWNNLKLSLLYERDVH